MSEQIKSQNDKAWEALFEKYDILPHLQSLSASSVPSETIAIHCALASGMLSDFLEEDFLYSTVSGRMGSGTFDFSIQNSRTNAPISVSVNHSQIEIDAALEGLRSLSLIEAKRNLSEENYSMEDTAITFSDLQDAFFHAEPVSEPETPFPQANCFERIINLCELLNTQEMNREQVTEKYAFDIRQTNYYTDAARYLGLLEKHYEDGRKPGYSLSAAGRRIMNLNYKQRQLAFCKRILQHRVFRETFRYSMEKGCPPDTAAIVAIMQESNLYKVESRSTYVRRSSTVSGWINWMLGLTGRNRQL